MNPSKYHLTPGSGAIKGNNPFILNRMSISNDFKSSTQMQIPNMVGYDAQGNMISNTGQNMLAGFDTNSNYSFLDQPQLQLQLQQQPQPQFQQQPQFQMQPVLTPQLLSQIDHAHKSGSNSKSNSKSSRKHQLLQQQQSQMTLQPPQMQYDHMYAQYSDQQANAIQNPAVAHRNNQLANFRTMDQHRHAYPTPMEIPQHMMQPQMPQMQMQPHMQQMQPQGHVGGVFNEPVMDNGLWYKKQQPIAPQSQSQPQPQMNIAQLGSYSEAFETGSTLGDAFRQPDMRSWKKM